MNGISAAVERGLEVDELGVGADKDGDLGGGDALAHQATDAPDERRSLGVGVCVGEELGIGPIGAARAQLAAGDQAVGQRQHLRRAAVVGGQADDAGAGVSVREGLQVGAARAGEAVDRLVRVTDDAEVAPVAEP